MGNIRVSVRNKIATNMTPDEIIVCGNSDYSVTFDFDEEWSAFPDRVALFTYYQGNKKFVKDRIFTGNTVSVPVLSGIDYVLVGVYAGNLNTTTPARVLCRKSILCGDATEQITLEEKAGLQAQIGVLSALETTNKGNLVRAINELYQLCGGELDPAIVESAVKEYLEANPPSDGVNFEVDKTLKLEGGILSVNTTNDVNQDNTLPITSAGVATTVGNIEILLTTI